MLNTLPVELSFVDADDTVRYFSHENREKIFGRTRGAIGTKVQNCHPQKSVHMVSAILADFKAGTARGGGVLDRPGAASSSTSATSRCATRRATYLGCLEVVQDVTGDPGADGTEAAAGLGIRDQGSGQGSQDTLGRPRGSQPSACVRVC